MAADALISLDTRLFLFINNLSHPWFDTVFVHSTEFKFWILPIVLLLGYMIYRYRKKVILPVVLCLITVAITDPFSSKVLKPAIRRQRPSHPEYMVQGGRYLSGMKRSLSFPSSHAANMFAQAALFTFLFPRFWIWFFTFAIFIGYSRVYVGVHYPGDVIGGAIVGVFIGTGVYWAYFAIRRRILRVEQNV